MGTAGGVEKRGRTGKAQAERKGGWNGRRVEWKNTGGVCSMLRSSKDWKPGLARRAVLSQRLLLPLVRERERERDLMMRPVHVIRDSVNERNCVQIIKPPEFIAEEVWGPPVTLAYYQDVHYEGTVTVPISPGVQLGAGDAGIQLGDVRLEQAQQATRPPWEVFEQELEVRVGLALRDGSDPVDLLEQDEARKALVSEIGVHRAFHQAGAEVQDHCALQSLREVAAFINCERVGEGHRWAELKFEERLAYGPVDASEMLGPVVVDALAEEWTRVVTEVGGRESSGLEVEEVSTPVVVGSDGEDTADSADDVEME